MAGFGGLSREVVHTNARERRNAQRLAFRASNLVGNGLTVDGTGRIVIDLATDSGLEFNAGDLRIDAVAPLLRTATGLEFDISTLGLESPTGAVDELVFLDDTDSLNKRVLVENLFRNNIIYLDPARTTSIAGTASLISFEVLSSVRVSLTAGSMVMKIPIDMSLNALTNAGVIQGDDTNPLIVESEGGGSATPGTLIIRGGQPLVIGDGGSIEITGGEGAGTSPGDGGSITITAGDAGGGSKLGGDLILESGEGAIAGFPADGTIIFKAPDGSIVMEIDGLTLIDMFADLDMNGNDIIGAIMDADFSLNGMMVRTASGSYIHRTITGTAKEIVVTDGDGVLDNPLIGIADNPVITGTESITVPKGTTPQRPGTPIAGMIRYNSTLNQIEAYEGVILAWRILNVNTQTETLGFSAAGATVAKFTTRYLGEGSGNVTATIADAEFHVPRAAGTLKNFRVYVSASATDANTTVEIYKNGSSTGIIVTYGAGVTGLLTDLVNTVAVVIGDKVLFRVLNGSDGGGGAKDIVIEMISLEYTSP